MIQPTQEEKHWIIEALQSEHEELPPDGDYAVIYRQTFTLTQAYRGDDFITVLSKENEQ